ncbi:MAG TPA: nucleotidyltransferase domain-containing protein [Candidatus Nanoarchaeia archaeon]|nr:nucleotidyltransferase domain-containing protein [Candidatus Nanoarchaeia archaeon]
MDKKIVSFMKKLKKMPDFHRVKFVILYGSRASGKANLMSDYDLAVYYEGGKDERFRFRVSALGLGDNYDLQIFQDLPIYVRSEVLKGEVVYAEDLAFVGDAAYATIKEFEIFKKYYYDYLNRRPLVT